MSTASYSQVSLRAANFAAGCAVGCAAGYVAAVLLAFPLTLELACELAVGLAVQLAKQRGASGSAAGKEEQCSPRGQLDVTDDEATLPKGLDDAEALAGGTCASITHHDFAQRRLDVLEEAFASANQWIIFWQ